MSNEELLDDENLDAHTLLGELFKPIRDLAKNFDVDLTKILTKYSQEILQTGSDEGESSNHDEFQQINFTEAALVIQGSASIYGKKVEFLYNLASKLLQFLHDERKKGGSDKRKDKDVLVAGRHNDDFVAHDEIKYQPEANKLNEDFATAHRRYVQTFLSRTPLALVTLSEAEKGDTMLVTKSGEVFGNRNDYNMNICRRDECDFLTLPTLSSTGLNDSSTQDTSHASVLSSCSSNIGNLSCGGDFPASDESMHVEFQQIGDNLPTDIDTNTAAQGTPNKAIAQDMQDDDDCHIHEDPICDDLPDELPPEKSHVPDLDLVSEEPHNGSRRRSLRQAKKQEEEKAAAAKIEEVKKKWTKEVAQDVSLPIQKEERKTRRPRRRKVSSRDSKNSAEVINEAMNKGRKGLDLQKVTLDSKTLKKMPPAKDISVNEAFELLFANNYQDEKEVAEQLRRQLPANNEASPDDGFGELDEPALDVDDHDNPSPDIDGCNHPDLSTLNTDDCFSPDSGCAGGANEPLHSPSDLNLSFESVLRRQVESYMKEADKYVENTELSERVKLWEEKIKPVLDLESKRETFDIHLYGTRIIDKFENSNRKQTVPFAKVVQGKTSWEICRYFLATLVLANNNNVEISSSNLPSGMHDVNLTLLSRKRHQEQLDAFGHGSGEHD